MDFNKEDIIRYFVDNYECWYCGENGAYSFHHVHPKSDTVRCSPSLFNCAPLHNFKCHIDIHGRLCTEEWRGKLLRKTAKYLFSQHAKLKDIDKQFLFDNRKILLDIK